MEQDYQSRKNEKKNNSRKKMLVLYLSIVLIMVFIILSNNYFDVINQTNIHNSKQKVYSNIEIHSVQNKKRILTDTHINSWTANDQLNPKVSSLSNGNFVVVWQSYLQNSSSYSIYGQIFYSNGAKKGNEFHMSGNTTLNQHNPNVAASSSGKFMVV